MGVLPDTFSLEIKPGQTMSLIKYLGEASKEDLEFPFLDVFKERVHVLLDILSNAVRFGKKGTRLGVV